GVWLHETRPAGSLRPINLIAERHEPFLPSAALGLSEECGGAHYHTTKSACKGVRCLDLAEGSQYPTRVIRLKGTHDEEDVSAEQTAAGQEARIPRGQEG